jgi:4-coumarate--CoA ligase
LDLKNGTKMKAASSALRARVVGSMRPTAAFPNRSHAAQLVRHRRFSGVVVKSLFNLPELSSNLVKMSLPQFMLKRIKEFPANDIAVVDGCNNVSMTYSEVHRNTFILGHAFRKLRLPAQTAVGLISPNQINYFTTIWALGLNELVSTPINHLYTEEEIKYQLSLTKAKVVIAHSTYLEKAAKVADELGIKVFVIDGDSHPSFTTINQLIADQASIQTDDSLFRGTGLDTFDSNSNFILPFSSGTTGKPKGVMLSHRNIITNCLQALVNEGKSLRAGEDGQQRANICPLPYFHIYGTPK